MRPAIYKNMVDERKKKAKEFVSFWQDIDSKGSEKQNTQKFWMSLLSDVYDVKNTKSYIEFEDKVDLSHKSFIDVYIPSMKILIEQKSKGIDLDKYITQSDGQKLTPYQQAQRYNVSLPTSKHARWIITCNFSEFRIYDMEHPNSPHHTLLLKDLPEKYDMLNILVDNKKDYIREEEEISTKAGVLVGKLYDAILKKYKDKDSDETKKSLNILCVRLVFLFYAEDAGLLGEKSLFTDFVRHIEAKDLREKLKNLFQVLDTKEEERDPYLTDDMKAFPYINGGLFKNENIEIPLFDDDIKNVIIKDCGDGFDWATISPTIFGAVFESTLNPEVRRTGGMHYTSIENIHKVIDPLFLDDLKEEFEEIREISVINTKIKKLDDFIYKISNLVFLDPACGSGNFLTETYKALRILENKCLKLKNDIENKKNDHGSIRFNFNDDIIKVRLDNFFGIEINDFAVTVAKTAMWIAEHQMLKETEEILYSNIDYLPLKHYAHIVEGNALNLNWDHVINGTLDSSNNTLENIFIDKYNPKGDIRKADYIMGNPPFVGAKLSTNEQKQDMDKVFEKYTDRHRKLDYVTSWYVKASEYCENDKDIKVSFVSTNSITQGEQVEILWSVLKKFNIEIIFAWQTFKWGSESNDQAAVYCVIVGFKKQNDNNINKFLYDSSGIKRKVDNINLYLSTAESITLEKRQKPICGFVPEMTKGSQLIDGGGFIIDNEDEKNNFILKYPEAKPYIFKYCNADSYLNNREQKYCICLKGAPASLIKNCKGIYERVKIVQEYRTNSTAISTNKLKDRPTEFFITNIPKGNSILVPVVSSERRRYIPLGYLEKGIIYTNATNYVDDATLYHFAILTSNVHMAWMRTVAGRLKSDYRYSKDIVYNNFPWPIDLSSKDTELNGHPIKDLTKDGYPTVDDVMKKALEQSAKAILDARDLYKDSSLAELYDPINMPKELLKAHQNNDKLVCKAYNLTGDNFKNEESCVKAIFDLYKKII